MGVEFFPCYSCGETVCDAGRYAFCDGCGHRFCEDCHKGPVLGRCEDDDEEEARAACPVCSMRAVGEYELHAFLLMRLGWTQAQAEEQYREWARAEKEKPAGKKRKKR